MAFAVATNEWLTVTTSSPARTPRASSATWSAAVQLDTAHACAAPTAAANSASKADTSGPCVIQPERMARRAASASGSPRLGFARGTDALLDTSGLPRRPVAHDLLFQQLFGRSSGG